MNPPPIPSPTSPRSIVLEPMPQSASATTILESLLKYPGRILHELQERRAAAISLWLLIFALAGMALYGVVVGTLTGGAQLWIAPTKMAVGTLLAMLICLPSLYIFACLDGIQAPIATIAGLMFATVALAAVLLIGFAPVGWIFSQSTDSVALMGTLHLVFWAIGIAFGLRLLGAAGELLGLGGRRHLKVWSMVFVLVCLQMTTTLRPIVGHANTFLPREKKFFVANWADSVKGK